MDWYEQYCKKPRGSTNFALIGVSLGSVISAIVMAVDGRLKHGVLVVSGGNINRIIGEGFVTAFVRRQMQRDGIDQAEYKRILEDFDAFLARVRAAPADAKLELPQERRWFVTDPLTFAHLNRGKSILMINAKYDLAVPRVCTEALWHALGEPEIVWLNCSHSTIIFYTPTIMKAIFRTLSK